MIGGTVAHFMSRAFQFMSPSSHCWPIPRYLRIPANYNILCHLINYLRFELVNLIKPKCNCHPRLMFIHWIEPLFITSQQCQMWVKCLNIQITSFFVLFWIMMTIIAKGVYINASLFVEV